MIHPPLKWSDLRYVFDIKQDCNGKESQPLGTVLMSRERRRARYGQGFSRPGSGQSSSQAVQSLEAMSGLQELLKSLRK
jgi:hypothetical protein